MMAKESDGGGGGNLQWESHILVENLLKVFLNYL